MACATYWIPAMDEPLIDVKDLKIRFRGAKRDFDAVRGISFTIGREKVGIVGESGSGKSLTGRSLLKLTPKGAHISATHMRFKGADLLSASEREMRKIRGNHISMILQDPKYSLNPLMRIGNQIVEAYRLHHKAPPAEAKAKALAMLEAVQIRDPERVFELFPHEVSGGMGQRVMIAMMLICGPELLIADEPTSALDVTVQLEVLAILDKLVAERGMGLIFISHDLRLVSSFCNRVLVMYAGRVVEELASADLSQAQHPYTRGLLNCLPTIGSDRHPLPVLDRKPEWAL